MAPFSPDDDRFYQTLDKSGQAYQKYRDRVAEDQAASTRELGNIYGQMPVKALNAGLGAADWRMKREKDNQSYQMAEENAQRARNADEQAAEQRAAEEAYSAAPAEEGYANLAGVPYKSGMTNRQLNESIGMHEKGLKDRELGQKDRDLAQKLGISEAEMAAKSKHERDQLNFDFKKLAQEKTIEDAKLVAAANKIDDKPATGEQLNAAAFGRKAQDAEHIVQQLYSKGYDPGSWKKSGRDFEIPLIGGKPYAKPEDREYEAAKKEWIAALLRKESGAAISPSEYEQFGAIYFPERGEPKEVQTMKAARRQAAAQNLILMAGDKASKQIPNQPYMIPDKQGGDGTAVAAPAAPMGPTKADQDAILWLQDPKNAGHPAAAGVRAKLKAKGLLGNDQAFQQADMPIPVTAVN